MPKRAIVLGVLAATAVVAAAGCGKSGGTKTTATTVTSPTATTSAAPQIVKFDGPSVVPCGKKGQIKTVSFTYVVRNATAVEPEVDGQSPGAQAGYNPRHGRMHFPYICPGPHKLTISAFGHGVTFSRSATVVPESSG